MSFLLLESGDTILLEDGSSKILLEDPSLPAGGDKGGLAMTGAGH